MWGLVEERQKGPDDNYLRDNLFGRSSGSSSGSSFQAPIYQFDCSVTEENSSARVHGVGVPWSALEGRG